MADHPDGCCRDNPAVLGGARLRGAWWVGGLAVQTSAAGRNLGGGPDRIRPGTANPPVVCLHEPRLQPTGCLLPLLPTALAAPGSRRCLRGCSSTRCALAPRIPYLGQLCRPS